MEELRALGLTMYESAVYEALVRHGRSVAKDLSAYSHVPPTAVYPVLQSLMAKGLIITFKGDVAQFDILPLTTAIPSLVERKIKGLQEFGEDVLPKLIAQRHKASWQPQQE